MTEAQPNPPNGPDPAPSDPSSDVADSQAPAHLEERGLDEGLENALDRGAGSSDE